MTEPIALDIAMLAQEFKTALVQSAGGSVFAVMTSRSKKASCLGTYRRKIDAEEHAGRIGGVLREAVLHKDPLRLISTGKSTKPKVTTRPEPKVTYQPAHRPPPPRVTTGLEDAQRYVLMAESFGYNDDTTTPMEQLKQLMDACDHDIDSALSDARNEHKVELDAMEVERDAALKLASENEKTAEDYRCRFDGVDAERDAAVKDAGLHRDRILELLRRVEASAPEVASEFLAEYGAG